MQGYSEFETQPSHPLGLRLSLGRREHKFAGYVYALVVVGVCGVITHGLQAISLDKNHGLTNGLLVFLLGVVFVAVRYGTGPSVLASVAISGTLAFFFMAPIWNFAVDDMRQLFSLVSLLIIGLVISALTSQVLHQTGVAKRNAERFESLYRLSRELADLAGSEQLSRAAVKHIQNLVGGTAAVLLPEFGRGFRAIPPLPLATEFRAREWSAASAAFESGHATGLGTHTTPNVTALFLPLTFAKKVVGVLAVQPPDGLHEFTTEQQHMLNTLAGQLTGALERDRLSHQVQTAQNDAESERMRAALLSCVSHDLRTPLAVIAGASSSMLDDEVELTSRSRQELCRTIFENADRLARIVDNLLNMTRIESGTFKVAKQQHVLEEVVGSTLSRMSEALGGRKIETRIAPDLPLIPMDDVLFQQVLFNLLDNAQKYVPQGSPIEIAASIEGVQLRLDVADRGPGLLPGEESRVFEKFYRAPDRRQEQFGSGLGLTVCQAIIAAHGGKMAARNRDGGGAVFCLWIPLYMSAAEGAAKPSLPERADGIATLDVARSPAEVSG
jgi:two-component system sensor histidine kinase KdpD